MVADRLPSILVTAGWGLAVIAGCFGGFHLFGTAYPGVIPSTGAGLGAGLLFLLGGLLAARGSVRLIGVSHRTLAALLLLVALSDIPHRRWTFFPTWQPLVTAASLMPLLLFLKSRRPRLACTALLVFAILTPAAVFLNTAHGRLLFSDDHPAFLYRLSQLKETFPAIPFYNPLWNAGVEAREFFPSGVLNLFFLTAPAVYLFPVEQIYNYSVLYLMFLIVPGTTYLAARMLGLTGMGPLIAAVLSITSSGAWYRWAFSYGTLGFICSSAFLPLTAALFERAVAADRTFSWRHGVLLASALTLLLLWPLGVIMTLPLLLGLLIRPRVLLRRRAFLAALAAVVILNTPWMLLFAQASRVGSFVKLQQESTAPQMKLSGPEAAESAAGGLKGARAVAGRVNPVHLLLFIPGLLLLHSRRWRLYAAVVLWLLFLGTAMAPLKPQLELERMLVVAVFLSSIPAAAVLSRLGAWRAGPEPAEGFPLGIIWLGALALGASSVVTIARGDSRDRLHFAGRGVQELAQAISEHAGPGRVLFSGFVLHDLSHGHVAPLAYFTGKPLMASHYQHSLWRYTDVIPRAFRDRKETGVYEFLDLYNVTAVVAHEKFWRTWFEQRADQFSPVWRKGRFALFRRNVHSAGGYFLAGEGEVLEQTADRVRLLMKSERAVVKFNYYPFLESSACRLAPFNAAEGIQFVELTDCAPGTAVELRAAGPFSRLFEANGQDSMAAAD